MSFDKKLTYDNSHRRNNQFSVTTGRDGSRTFYGEHDNRFNSNFNSSRGYRGRSSGSYRGNRGTRGRSGFRNVNTRYSKSRFADDDGDVSMGGPSRGGRDRGRQSRNRGRGRISNSNSQGGQNKHEKWFKCMVPFGAAISKDELFKLITDNIEGNFDPVQYDTDEKRAYFYVEGRDIAEGLRSLSRRVTKSDGHKLVLHIQMSGAPEGTVNAEGQEKLKIRMSDRYDPSTQLLNLSSLYSDEKLLEERVFFPLNRPATMRVVIEIIKNYIPELTGLDVSGNKIMSLGHMTEMVKAAPGLTSLNLGRNNIKSLEELEKLKGWGVTELVLDGNELCNNYSNKNTYVSAVRKIFPKIVTLDGNTLPPQITFDLDTEVSLPTSKDCYFVNDDVKGTLVTFVKEYFNYFDSDRRRDLTAAYHENAQFTLCTSRNPVMGTSSNKQRSGTSDYVTQKGFSMYMEDSRNLKRIGHLDSEKLLKKSKFGVLGVVSVLESLPKSKHDISTFKMDLTLALPTMLSFVLHGVFKENDARFTDRDAIRSFSRSFVIVPQGTGMVIVNDMLMISNASYELCQKSFKDPLPSPSVSQTPQATPSDAGGLTSEQVEQVKNFSTQSGMNMDFSMHCLRDNGWDYQKAATVFTNLQSEGKIPPAAFVKSEAV